MALLPGSADGPTPEGPAAAPTTGTLGDLMVQRTARDRRLLWKRLGLAASGTFTLAAAITVVTGAALRQPPAPTPAPVAAPSPEQGLAPSGPAPLVDGPIVAPEAPPVIPPPPVLPPPPVPSTGAGAGPPSAEGTGDAGPGGGSSGHDDHRGGCPDGGDHGGGDHGGSHDRRGHDRHGDRHGGAHHGGGDHRHGTGHRHR